MAFKQRSSFAALTNNYNGDGDGDGDDKKKKKPGGTTSKTKTKTKKFGPDKGSEITTTKYKIRDPKTGKVIEKGGSKTVVDPTSYDISGDFVPGLGLMFNPNTTDPVIPPEVTKKETDPTTTPGDVTTTPPVPDSGETPPGITPPGPPSPGGETKPVKTKGWRESYTPEVAKKWEGKGGFEAYKTAGIKWNEEQKAKTNITPGNETKGDPYAEDIQKMKPRGIKPIEVNTPSTLTYDVQEESGEKTDHWRKRKGEKKKFKTTRPPGPRVKGDGLFGEKCNGDECSAFGPIKSTTDINASFDKGGDHQGESWKTRKAKRQSNREARQYRKRSEQSQNKHKRVQNRINRRADVKTSIRNIKTGLSSFQAKHNLYLSRKDKKKPGGESTRTIKADM